MGHGLYNTYTAHNPWVVQWLWVNWISNLPVTCQGHSTPMLPEHYSVPSQGQLVRLAVLTQ